MNATLEQWLGEVGQHAYGWPESLRFTYDTTRRLLDEGVRGDLVECGVGAGVHVAAMGRACLDAGARRTIRCFDSFQGVPNGGPSDSDWNSHWGDGSGALVPTGVAAHALVDVQGNLRRWGLDGDMYAFHVGWFQETLPPLTPVWRDAIETGRSEGIAFLRLDGDLYESTRVCLDRLYPLVVQGGVVVLDDWNLDGCRKAFFDFFWSAGVDVVPAVEEITASGDVWWTKP